jgi:hypothetical protein
MGYCHIIELSLLLSVMIFDTGGLEMPITPQRGSSFPSRPGREEHTYVEVAVLSQPTHVCICALVCGLSYVLYLSSWLLYQVDQ